ncbi:aldo/keto reductase [Marispirochaeta aestuarii]|uniref:aldo/keto reductase n=1 Tax=Marispirochaeta aestuarii TaxID=1963862 RepID=UPI0029C93D2D|nr:aldo/keto reductase [Marispirochaeta aestuarii]
MEYRVFGRTGVMVSSLCFGTMSFGGIADREESARMYAACRDAGVNFFDCANSYNKGASEEILGDLIHPERENIIITSKYTVRTGPDINAIGSSRRNALLEVEKSLKRLKTDYIDLYFVHNFDPYTHIEEVLMAMDDLVRQGKVLYLGVSNWAAWQISKALGLSFHYGWNRFECIQPMYNLLKRQAETEILPLAAAENMAVISYSPLAGGLLSGKYKPGEKPKSGRFAEQEMYVQRYGREEYHLAAAEFAAYARNHGVDPVTLMIAWVKSHPALTAPIIGARNTDQLQYSLAAADYSLTPEMRDDISSIFPGPPPAHDRLEETVDDKYLFRNK